MFFLGLLIMMVHQGMHQREKNLTQHLLKILLKKPGTRFSLLCPPPPDPTSSFFVFPCQTRIDKKWLDLIWDKRWYSWINPIQTGVKVTLVKQKIILYQGKKKKKLTRFDEIQQNLTKYEWQEIKGKIWYDSTRNDKIWYDLTRSYKIW